MVKEKTEQVEKRGEEGKGKLYEGKIISQYERKNNINDRQTGVDLREERERVKRDERKGDKQEKKVCLEITQNIIKKELKRRYRQKDDCRFRERKKHGKQAVGKDGKL